ncbi:hypothetical protein DFH09DRAFT_1399468 [Mycena vulgaris]|nr:hypothetical protein DFH09DRAFT_1399468 [Mycena vulgaris]
MNGDWSTQSGASPTTGYMASRATTSTDLLQEDNATISWDVFNALCQKGSDFFNVERSHKGLELPGVSSADENIERNPVVLDLVACPSAPYRPSATSGLASNSASESPSSPHIIDDEPPVQPRGDNPWPPSPAEFLMISTWSYILSTNSCGTMGEVRIAAPDKFGKKSRLRPRRATALWSPMRHRARSRFAPFATRWWACTRSSGVFVAMLQFRIFEENTYRDSKVKFNDLPVGTASDSAEGGKCDHESSPAKKDENGAAAARSATTPPEMQTWNATLLRGESNMNPSMNELLKVEEVGAPWRMRRSLKGSRAGCLTGNDTAGDYQQSGQYSPEGSHSSPSHPLSMFGPQRTYPSVAIGWHGARLRRGYPPPTHTDPSLASKKKILSM